MTLSTRPRWAALAGLLATLVVAAGCGSPGSGSSTAGGGDKSDGKVATSGFEKLGSITLHVWADSGEEATMKRLIPKFESKYPNVKVDLSLHAFDDHIKLIVNAMAGSNPPDVAQGGHGFLTDGALVKAGLIRPLDAYSKAYGWEERFGSDTLSYTRWTDGAKSFGSGTLYGISPITELVGVYYNKQLLHRLGAQPPKSEAEFESLLGKAKAAGIQPIALGNADKYPATHVFSLLQGQEVPAADVRNWIAGKPGSTFDSPGTRKAADTMVKWAKAGYFGKDFNGVSADDAVAKFGKGDALFLLAGSWNVPNINQALGKDAGYMNFPPGKIGKPAGAGAPGLPWHISSKTKHPDVAAAFLAMLFSKQFIPDLVAVDRPPAQPGAQATGLLAEVTKAVDAELKAGGAMGSYDHTSATMLETFGSKMQELLAGRIDTADFVSAVQADWAKAHGG